MRAAPALLRPAPIAEAEVFVTSVACAPTGSCVALARFPLQAWGGALPKRVLLPLAACAFAPRLAILQEMRPTLPVPCPADAHRFLRWYDDGELWGKVTESARACGYCSTKRSSYYSS